MRNTGLLPGTSVRQRRWQVCREAVGIVKNQENLTLLLGFPQGEEVSSAYSQLSQGTTTGIGNTSHSRLTEARERLAVQSVNVSSNRKGVHPGQEAMGGADTQGESWVILYNSGRKFISSSQWQERDAGKHAQRALCARPERLWQRFTLGWAFQLTHMPWHNRPASCPPTSVLCKR